MTECSLETKHILKTRVDATSYENACDRIHT